MMTDEKNYRRRMRVKEEFDIGKRLIIVRKLEIKDGWFMCKIQISKKKRDKWLRTYVRFE